MIDDLFTELAVGAVDRLLSPETPRDEADFGLARLNARLSPTARRDDRSQREWGGDSEPELEPRLLEQYLQLSVDDLQQISPRVHEWLLDRLSQSRVPLNADDLPTLAALYFLFPESTVRHSVVGILVQTDDRRDLPSQRQHESSLAVVWDAIDQDAGLSDTERINQLQLLAEALLDYIDLLPQATERILLAFHQGHRDDALTTHLIDWSTRLGGESGGRIRRAVEGSDRSR